MEKIAPKKNIDFDYRYGFSMKERSVKKTRRGITEKTVRDISRAKNEPQWMLEKRLAALTLFKKKPLPSFGPDLSSIDFHDITYYLKATEQSVSSWKDLPKEIKETYDRIGVPEAERDFLAGVSAQYESEVVYESVRKDLKKKGVIFCDMDTAVRKYPEIVKEYFGTLVPPHDNTFAALNSAVWSGGSFIYVPKKVKIDLPLQAYFRINAERFGQFERTLIIADEESFLHYTEGCTAPIYTTSSLHAAVVEIIVKKNARVRYTTVQNWSKNIYNLVTKRARAETGAIMEWVDCNIGSGITMKYPAIYLTGAGARGEMLSIALAGNGQTQDTGGKMIHLASNTTSRVVSKSISKGGGRNTYRGIVHIAKGAKNARASVICDALILDDISRSDTSPTMRIREKNAIAEHEASIERIDADKMFYLRSRGLSENDARGLLINGFIEPITREIPFEYAIELNRLINMEMEGSIG